MDKKNWQSVVNLLLVVAIALIMALPTQQPVKAAAVLTITPITWNVIGLDSNNVNVGPSNYPVGARVCNTGDSTSGVLTADFVWDSANPYINLTPGNNRDPLPYGSGLDAGKCADFFFEVEITRTDAAYNATRRYHIEVTEQGGVMLSTPTPRELYVEKLVSQSRNYQTNVQLSTDNVTYIPFGIGEQMTLMVGQTYFIRLDSSTATNGYEQIESYLNLPNVYFNVLGVTQTYTAETSATMTAPYDRLYGDACVWENDPYSLNYRSCLGTGKAGGTLTTTYKVIILGVRSSDPTPVYGMIYDFSGSSYHYNSDYESDARLLYNNDPLTSVNIYKSFNPDEILPGSVSSLTLRVVNTSPSVMTNLSFSDTFPTGMTLANVTYSTLGCGTPTLTGVTAGSNAISVSNITLQERGTCSLKFNVTATNVAQYDNTTGLLYLNGVSTGKTATDSLTVSTSTACTAVGVVANWTVPSTATAPPDTTGGIPSLPSPAVTTAVASSPEKNTIDTVGTDGYWEIRSKFGNTTRYADKYFQFAVNVSAIKDLTWSFELYRGSTTDPQKYDISYINGGVETFLETVDFLTTSGNRALSYSFLGMDLPGTTQFRIYPYVAGNTGNDSNAMVDDIKFEGSSCTVAFPTITKSFTPDPIILNGESVLTFTINNKSTNPASGNLTGVAFDDELPVGLTVINDATHTPSTTCTSGSVSAPNGGTTIALTGASLAANGSCVVSVYVRGNSAGTLENISGRISSTQTGENPTSTGFATDTITVIAPPRITKAFGLESITVGSSTSITFNILNPNINVALTNVNFTDTLAAGLVVTTPNGLTNTCGGTATATAGSSSISLSAVNLAALATCRVTVNVTGNSVGAKLNSVTVSSTNGGTGNTSTDTLNVRAVAPSIALTKQVATNLAGPWQAFLTDVPTGSTIYYRFVVENTGDVPLSGLNVVDSRVNMSTCVWPNPLPAPAVGNENHIATCTITATAGAGVFENTATATATYLTTTVTSTDTAWYSTPANYGHLPYDTYNNMNLFIEGGARHLTSATGARLGNQVPSEKDGSSSEIFEMEASDDGVTFNPDWVAGTNGGSITIQVNCPTGTCVLAGWIDWNKDGDFGDSDEQVVYRTGVTTGSINVTFNIPLGTDLDLNEFYARFRVYQTAPDGLSPEGEAKTSSTATIGEVEDYQITVIGGDPVATPVTLSYFLAERSGNTVDFSWSTSTETANLGFNLYVDGKSGREKINSELIASQVINSLSRQDYTYTAGVKGDVFYIEDVSTRGETRLHGPFQAGKAEGTRVEGKKINWGQVQKENREKQNERKTTLVSDLKLPSSAALPAASVTFKVNRTGIYRVSFEQLLAEGFDLTGAAASGISLTNRGKMVPVYLSSTTAFGPGSYIEFYGQALDTVYTDTNVYTLVTNASNPPRITYNDKTPITKLSITPSYLETLTVNRQNVYADYAPGVDRWFDTNMLVYTTAQSWKFPFTVDGLANTTTSTTLKLTVWGVTDWPAGGDHHLKVSVNNTPSADITYDGWVEQNVTLTLPAGLLVEGENTLTLTLPADAGVMAEVQAMDQFSVSYPRQFKARDGRLTFSSTGRGFRVTHLTSSQVVVYRIGADLSVTRLKASVSQSADGTYTATFPGDGRNSTYVVSSVNALHAPELEATKILFDANTPAEYLIIAHPNFIPGLAPLITERQKQYSVRVVDVMDLYSQFTYGIFDPEAIRQYIRYAAQNLGTKSVLLVGGDTYDYRDYLGIGSVSFIPSIYAKTDAYVTYTPVDPLYADVNGDNIPDLQIGRFPVRTTAELDVMVQKTLAYANKTYTSTGVFSTDVMDQGVSFKLIGNQMAETLPDDWSVQRYHLDDLSLVDARTGLLGAMNNGTALVTFVGHSGPVEWTFSGLFTSDDASALSNYGKPFVVAQWGCWNTYYIDPLYDSMTHSLLFSGNQGAAAVLGATGLSDIASEELLGEILTPQLARSGLTIGQAVQLAKSELGKTHPEMLDVLLAWTLMGDPALIIAP